MHRHKTRTVRTILAASVAVAGILAASVTTSPSHAAPGHAAKINTTPKSGTILFSDWEFPPTLNTFQSGLSATTMTMNLVNEGLDIYNSKAQLEPDLLATLPSIKNKGILNGGKTIILKLKPGMYWSNGQQIVNKDILFGWQMEQDKATGPACLGTCDHIAAITLQGKLQATLKLKDDYAPILANGLPIVWPHGWAAAGTTPHAAALKWAQDTTFNFENPTYVTDGPYQVSQYVNNDRIVLTPMKYYHIHAGPFVSKFIYAFYSDKTAMIAGAAQDATNVTTDYTLADLPALKPHTNVYKIYNTASLVEEHLEYNCVDKTVNGQPNPLTNMKVRQALTLAIDKIGMMRSALGISAKTAKSIEAWSPWTVTKSITQAFGDKSITGAWDPIAKKYLPYSSQTVNDAKTLLRQAGYPNGFNISVTTTEGNPTRANEFAVIQNNWAAIGVKAALVTVPASLILGDWNANGPLVHGNFEVSLWAFGQSPDPDGLHNYFESRFIDRLNSAHADVDSNFAGIDNKLIDEGMQKGATSFDPKVRKKWYTIVQQQMSQNAYWVPLYYRTNIITVDKHVKGAGGYVSFGYFGNTWNAWQWKYGSS